MSVPEPGTKGGDEPVHPTDSGPAGGLPALVRRLADRRHWLPLVLLVTLLAHVPSLANGFAMDDRAFASGAVNPMVATLHAPQDYWLAHYYQGISPSSVLYRPVTVLSYALRHAVAGDAPLPAHLANLLLHLCAVVLAWRLLAAAGATHGPACLGALVFGLHAIHSEAVANVVGRAELLGFVFGAAGCLALSAAAGLRTRPIGDPRDRSAAPPTGAGRLGLCVLAGLCLFLALCAKENAVCWLPFSALLLFVRGRLAGLRRIVPPLAAMLVPVLLWALLRHEALARVATDRDPTVGYLRNPLYFETGLARTATALMVWGYGLVLTLFPFALSADYSHAVFPIVRELASGPGLLALLAGAAILALTVLCLRALRRRPLCGLGLACWLGFSFVLSNLLVRTGTIFGERTWYTPSLGLAFVVAWLAARLSDAATTEASPAGSTPPASSGTAALDRAVHPTEAPATFAPRALAGLCVLGLWLGVSTRTILARNGVWRDDRRLFLHEARNQPRSARMQVAAAAIHAGLGEHRSAVALLREAVALDPGYAEAWANLGAAHLNLGEPAEARRALLQGLRARPWSLALSGPDLRAHLALACLRLGLWDEALRHLGATLEAAPARLRPRRDVAEALAALVGDASVDRGLRERAAALGREAFGAAARPPR